MTIIERRKYFNGENLHRLLGGIVQHGVMKGYLLHERAVWHGSDIASQLLGLYEQDVAAVLWYLARRRTLFIDIGAADGYYALGLISTGAYERSVCFELSQEGRDALVLRRAQLGLDARVEIHGDAVVELPPMILDGVIDPGRAVVLCDIEGAEFSLFTDELLRALAPAYIVIENHDVDRAAGCPHAAALRERAAPYFHVSDLSVGPRDLGRVPLVADWNDNDRALLLSEGRLSLASWLVLSPLSDDALTGERLSQIHAEYVRTHFA